MNNTYACVLTHKTLVACLLAASTLNVPACLAAPRYSNARSAAGGLTADTSCDSPGVGYHKGANKQKKLNAPYQIDTCEDTTSIGMSAQYSGPWKPNSSWNWACNGPLLSLDGNPPTTTGNQTFQPPASIDTESFYVTTSSPPAGPFVLQTDEIRFNIANGPIPGPTIQVRSHVNVHGDWVSVGPDPASATSVTSLCYYAGGPILPSDQHIGLADVYLAAINPPGTQPITASATFTITAQIQGVAAVNYGIPLPTGKIKLLDSQFQAWLSLTGQVNYQVTTTVLPGCKTFPMLLVEYNKINKLYDDYNIHGYDQETSVCQSDNWEWSPSFTPSEPWNASGYPIHFEPQY